MARSDRQCVLVLLGIERPLRVLLEPANFEVGMNDHQKPTLVQDGREVIRKVDAFMVMCPVCKGSGKSPSGRSDCAGTYESGCVGGMIADRCHPKARRYTKRLDTNPFVAARYYTATIGEPKHD